MKTPPGAETEIKRFLPKLRYELIGCSLNGHELLGVNTEHIRKSDGDVVREYDGLRWCRCLRCDSWLPLPRPDKPNEAYLPALETIELPLRGKPLRDRYVLRLIAVDRALHVLVLSLLAVAIFLFAAHRTGLHEDYVRLLNSLQGSNGSTSQGGELGKLQSLFKLSSLHIYELAGVVIAYAVLEAVEMVGLWFAKRWAEYLTFLATLVFIPYEVYELIHKVTVLKVVAFAINVGIALYLLYAKRLFGLRGGGKAEHAECVRDIGWEAIRRATPK